MPEATQLIWRSVYWPSPLEASFALGLLRRLASDEHRPVITWEVVASEGQIRYRVAAPAHFIRELDGLIETMVPGTVTTAEETPRPTFHRATSLRFHSQALTLAVDLPAAASRAILGALSAARFRGEQLVLQLLLGRGRQPTLVPPRGGDPTQGWIDLLRHGSRPPSPEVATRLRAKTAEPGVEAHLRVGVAASSENRQISLLQGVLAALRTLDLPGVELAFVRERPTAITDVIQPTHWPLRLSSSEVLSLTGWPLDSSDLPGLPAPHPKLLRLNAQTAKDTETSRVFATTNAPGQARPIGISKQDSLFHTIALGPTGSGKSTALLNLIVRDLEAGHGLAVVDPKADLVHDILERIPPSRRDDVVVLNPTDVNPVGLNPLRSDGTAPELIADGILQIFRDLFPSAFGPRVADVTHAALLTLAYCPGSTLTWLVPLLTDGRFRQKLLASLPGVEELQLSSYWDEFDQLSPRQQSQHVAPVLSRLRQFLLRPGLRRVLDQPAPRFNLTDIFTGHRVLLVPLNAGLIGNDSARLLGSLLVSQLWQLTLARSATPKEHRHPVSIVVDEVQEFLRLGGGVSDLSDALARSRSMGVAWHLAHQYRGQLSPDMKTAIDANARNKIIFGLGVKDARDMADMAPELGPEDFMALPAYHVYATVLRRGQNLGWVSGQTLPPPKPTSDPIDLIAASQSKYGRLDDTSSEPSFSSLTNGLTTGKNSATPPPPETPIGRKMRRTADEAD